MACAGLSAGAELPPPAIHAAAPSAPLFFVPNRGQAPGSVRYLSRTRRLTAYFSRGEVRFQAAAGAVRMKFEGARAAEPEPRRRLPGVVNYVGGAKCASLSGLPIYREMVYRGLYPGIDMVYGVAGRNLKSEFVVAAGANPAAIRVRYSGGGRPSIAADGALAIPLGAGPLREAAPTVYQEIGGRRVTVPGRFALAGETVSFEIGSYDASRPLVIDPAIAYSTLLGGGGADAANAVAVDAAGAVYVAGLTESTNFPVAGPARNFNAGGDDVFIAKFNASGSGLVYCTYLGGSGQDIAAAIAVDSTGAAYVAGSTTSSNFPLRSALQSKLAGARNAFAVKLSPAGNTLVYSTYLGGSGSDAANGIAVDAAGNAYLTGDTNSSNFPASGFQRDNRGGQDAFAAKISADGSRLVWSSCLGGGAADHGAAIAVDAAGEVWVTGGTWSSDFPTAGAFQGASGGGEDAFVARFSADGNTLAFSSYLGGSGGTAIYPETAQAIALDAAGNAYVAGVTSSSDFPTLKPVQAALKGAMDAFVTKVSAAGALVYSTYLGGSSVDIANAIAVDWSGAAYVAGYTYSTDLATVGALQTANAGECDAFLAKLNAAPALVYLSYLGGNGADTAAAVAVDGVGGVYLAGWTQSTNFPLLGAYQATDANSYGAFVTKFNFTATATATAVKLGAAALLTTYLGETGYIDFSSVPDGVSAASITDGTLTVSFDSAMEKQMAGPTLSTYWTWNLWPYSQLQTAASRMPALASGTVWPGPFTPSITVHLSEQVRTFGFEVTPANSSDALLTATFYASETDPGGSVVSVDHVGWLNGASCTASDCSGGSQIIAASGGPIKKVTVAITPHDIVSTSYPGDSFAIAGFRYSLTDQISGSVSSPVTTAPATPQPTPATLSSPASGSALPGASATFQWSTGVGVTQYWVYLSAKSAGAKDLYSASLGTNTSLTVSNMPITGGTVYLRLWSLLASGWQYIDYSFAAASAAGSGVAAPVTTSGAATISSPAASSTLTGAVATFVWTAGTSVTQYWLYLGTTGAGSKDIYSQSEGASRYQAVGNLPTNSGTIYARLWSKIGANWQYMDYTYRAATAPAK